MTTTPEGLDSTIHHREIVFEADVSSVTPYAPTPLMYFSAALAF